MVGKTLLGRAVEVRGGMVPFRLVLAACIPIPSNWFPWLPLTAKSPDFIEELLTFFAVHPALYCQALRGWRRPCTTSDDLQPA